MSGEKRHQQATILDGSGLRLGHPYPLSATRRVGIGKVVKVRSSLLCANPPTFFSNPKPTNAFGHSPTQLPQAKCLTKGKMPCPGADPKSCTMAYPTWKPPSLKFSQTHPRVGHTLQKLWPRGSTHTGHSHPFALTWLVAACGRSGAASLPCSLWWRLLHLQLFFLSFMLLPLDMPPPRRGDLGDLHVAEAAVGIVWVFFKIFLTFRGAL